MYTQAYIQSYDLASVLDNALLSNIKELHSNLMASFTNLHSMVQSSLVDLLCFGFGFFGGFHFFFFTTVSLLTQCCDYRLGPPHLSLDNFSQQDLTPDRHKTSFFILSYFNQESIL